jgi:tetratricopeptide (TPR) repeat protein
VALLAAALLAGAAAGGWWAWGRSRPPEPPDVGTIRDPEVRHALASARQDVLDHPRSAAAWGTLGMTLEAHLYEGEADRCFAQAARLDPADPRWPYFRGLYALKDDPDNALPFLRQAAETAGADSPYREHLRLRLAEALLERQETDEAEGLFRGEWQRAPGNPRAAFGLGLIAAERGDRAGAAEFLRVAQKSPMSRKKATTRLAALARESGDSAAAAEHEKALAALPGDVPAWPDPLVEQIVALQVGRRSREHEVKELERQRHFAEAAQVYLKELEEQPTVAAYLGAGVNLARLGDFDRALPLLRQAVQLDPDDAQAHYTLALILFLRAERAETAAPGSAEAREWFGESLAPARRATELKPDHARAYLHWGLALRHLRRPAEAVEPLRKGVACQPGDFDLQLALGEVLLDLQRREQARTHLENARRIEPGNPALARALERLGAAGKE